MNNVYLHHPIIVVSPEGNLLHTIGREGHQQGMFYLPRGVAVTPNGRLVCVSQNVNYSLQIFYWFVCFFLSILLPNESIVYLFFLYHMIYAHIFPGVKSLNSVFPRIVDPKCENEFIDTS